MYNAVANQFRSITTAVMLCLRFLADYDGIDDLDETPGGCLVIKTLEVPLVKRGDTVEITVRDRDRK